MTDDARHDGDRKRGDLLESTGLFEVQRPDQSVLIRDQRKD